MRFQESWRTSIRGVGVCCFQVLIAGVFSSLFFFKSSLITVRTSVGRLFKRHA